MPEELVPVDCPLEVRYLWEYYSSMRHRVRTQELTDLHVMMWCFLRGIELSAFEVEVLEALDNVFLDIREGMVQK